MAMSKIERIDKEIQKTREKITEYQCCLLYSCSLFT